MLEDKTLNFEYGECYVVNTTKQHTLFNCSTQYDSLWLVVNTQVTDESIRFIQDNLRER